LLQGGGGGATAGPRPAPAYRVVNTICEKREDGPGPRCGHTLTAVAAVGEEGSPGYVGPRLILFGGATALEGNTGPANPQGTPGGAGISMCTHTQTRIYPSLILCSDFLAPLVGFLHQSLGSRSGSLVPCLHTELLGRVLCNKLHISSCCCCCGF
jgi:hypothetical protein